MTFLGTTCIFRTGILRTGIVRNRRLSDQSKDIYTFSNLNKFPDQLIDIFVEWFRQDYGIDSYEDSAMGLAGAAIPKR